VSVIEQTLYWNNNQTIYWENVYRKQTKMGVPHARERKFHQNLGHGNGVWGEMSHTQKKPFKEHQHNAMLH